MAFIKEKSFTSSFLAHLEGGRLPNVRPGAVVAVALPLLATTIQLERLLSDQYDDDPKLTKQSLYTFLCIEESPGSTGQSAR